MNAEKGHRNEELRDIGISIQKHFDKERDSYNTQTYAIGRCQCTTESSMYPSKTKTFWLTNKENLTKSDKEGDEQTIYKNTRLGEILTKYNKGSHPYKVKVTAHKNNNVKVTIHNKAAYTPEGGGGISEVTIWLNNEIHRFQYLKDLLDQQIELEEKRKQLKASQKALKDARLAVEKAAQKEHALLEERRKRDEEEQLTQNIEKIEKQIRQGMKEIKNTRSFICKMASLRKQPLLDKYQETVKRSHFYDSVPVLIQGGPGTGKTTTLIQRLKFLLSKETLRDYEVSLPSKIEYLISNQLDNSWLFISPTDLLCKYVRDNMVGEGLKPNSDNTMELRIFKEKMLRDEYQLINLKNNAPFKFYKNLGEDCLIIDPLGVIGHFERYCVQSITSTLFEISKIETNPYSWHRIALGIKSYWSKEIDLKTMEKLLHVFNSLQDNEQKNVNSIVSELKDLVKKTAFIVKGKVMSDENMVEQLRQLFESWRKDRMVDDEEEYDLLEEEEDILSQKDLETELYKQLKSLIPKWALKPFEEKWKWNKRQTELYSIISPYLEESIQKQQIAELAWFVKKFAFLCRGIEFNVIKRIPQLYKDYRKNLSSKEQSLYKKSLLEKLIQKDNNKCLYPDEQAFILGFINNQLLAVYKRSRNQFDKLQHTYVEAYKRNIKPVLVIDEATDYTWMDYYMIYSFRHYEFSAVTLCGDIMQGLQTNGIGSWEELHTLMPKIEKYELKISYRQLPTLLEMAREMYKDDQGVYPNYQSNKELSDKDPLPLAFVSENEDEKVEWICKRILDVYDNYANQLPAIAVFVGENEDTRKLKKRFEESDILDGSGIHFKDCSDGDLNDKNAVRIFRLSSVKGMEFEVAFFHNIDKAMDECSSIRWMRRYLYVGVSRATTHLAATFMRKEGNEDIIRYFDTETDTWSK